MAAEIDEILTRLTERTEDGPPLMKMQEVAAACKCDRKTLNNYRNNATTPDPVIYNRLLALGAEGELKQAGIAFLRRYGYLLPRFIKKNL